MYRNNPRLALAAALAAINGAVALAVLASACGGSTASGSGAASVSGPASGAPTSATPAHAPPQATSTKTHEAAAPRVSDAASAPSASGSTPAADAKEIAQDVQIMVGGMWVVDHIGPERVATGDARQKAYPELYVAELRRRFDEAIPSYHADSQYPHVLGILSCQLPEQGKLTAREWMPKIRAVAARAHRAPRWDGEQRSMDGHVEGLQMIVDGKFPCPKAP